MTATAVFVSIISMRTNPVTKHGLTQRHVMRLRPFTRTALGKFVQRSIDDAFSLVPRGIRVIFDGRALGVRQ